MYELKQLAVVPTARDVRALFSITFLVRTISIIVQIVSPIVLVKVLHTQNAEIGWMIAGFWIANAIGAIIAAGVIRSRNKSTLSGFAVLVVSFMGAALLHNPLGFASCIVFSGLGLSFIQAFLIPTMHMSGTQEIPHMGIARYSTALSLGMIAGPLVADAAILVSGFYSLFFLLVAISTVMLFASFRMGIQKSFEGEDTRKSILPSSIIKTMKRGTFTNFYGMNFLYSLLLPILISYGGVFAVDRFHFTTIEVLILFAGIFSISSTMRALFSRSKNSQFRTFLVMGFIALFLSFVLIGLANSIYLLLIGFLLFSLPHAVIYPITTYLALESAGQDGLISSTYIFSTSSGIAEFISPLVVIPLITAYGLSTIFSSLAPLAIVGLIIAMLSQYFLTNRS